MTASLATTNAIASDPIGGLITSDGTIVYYLTECCGASGKGSDISPTGVVCRNCYRTVPSALGAGWLVADEAGWARYANALRPHLEQFTNKMVDSVRAAALARAGR